MIHITLEVGVVGQMFPEKPNKWGYKELQVVDPQ